MGWGGDQKVFRPISICPACHQTVLFMEDMPGIYLGSCRKCNRTVTALSIVQDKFRGSVDDLEQVLQYVKDAEGNPFNTLEAFKNKSASETIEEFLKKVSTEDISVEILDHSKLTIGQLDWILLTLLLYKATLLTRTQKLAES